MASISAFVALAILIVGNVPVPSAVQHSMSPDGKYEIWVKMSEEPKVYYYVQDKQGKPVSEDCPSDFHHDSTAAAVATSVSWRPDGKFVIVSTGHDRHHVDFLILSRTPAGFQVVPFDWERLDKYAQLAPLGFGYPSFLHWRPDGRAVVDLYEFEGRKIYRDSAFDLDLTGTVTPVSWRVLHEDQQIITP